MTSNDQQIDLVINKLKRAQYEELYQQGKIDETQLYIITDDPTTSQVVSSYLSDYYPKSETSSAIEIQEAFDNIPKPDLSEYYKKNETSSAIEIQNAIDDIPLSDYVKISVDNAPTGDLKLSHVSYDEYKQLVIDRQVDPHTVYVMSGDGYDDQFGNRIVNVGSPELSDDAATKGYVDSQISNIDVSQQLSGYVKLNSESQQDISSNVQVDGWLKVGNLSANGINVPSITAMIIGGKDLSSVIQQYVDEQIGNLENEINEI